MKTLKCELCGGVDLVKKDGFFVCEHCRVRYSVEEAKKMMIDGTVEVTGTVKVDSSEKLENLYQLARRAKDNNNADDAIKYYELILLDDVNSWEAELYKTYFRAMVCTTNNFTTMIAPIKSCISTVFTIIKKNIENENEFENNLNEAVSAFETIISAFCALANEHYKNDNKEREKIVTECSFAMLYLGDRIESFFGDKKYAINLSVKIWKSALNLIYTAYAPSPMHISASHNTVISSALVKEYSSRIEKYDSSFEIKKGCFIATAVYGSYDSLEVVTLRQYRDNVLEESLCGRMFINIYYATSPTFVKWFGNSKWFKTALRFILDNLIERLN